MNLSDEIARLQSASRTTEYDFSWFKPGAKILRNEEDGVETITRVEIREMNVDFWTTVEDDDEEMKEDLWALMDSVRQTGKMPQVL